MFRNNRWLIVRILLMEADSGPGEYLYVSKLIISGKEESENASDDGEGITDVKGVYVQ